MKRFSALIALGIVAAAHAEDGVVRRMDDNKFEKLAGMPTCMTAAVQSGDPAKGPSVILFKGAANCVIPWHWHTPAEQVMLIGGTAELRMKDGGKPKLIGEGGFGLMPSRHVHQFRCVRACAGFVASDGAFDIHYVDANGSEIAPDQALAPKK